MVKLWNFQLFFSLLDLRNSEEFSPLASLKTFFGDHGNSLK